MESSEPSAGGLSASVKRLCRHLGEALILRGRLVSLELARERQRMFSLLGWFAAAAFCGVMAVVMATLFVVVVFWESHRFIVMGSFVAAYILVALVAFFRVSRMLRNLPLVLEETIGVLEKDYQCISGKNNDTSMS